MRTKANQITSGRLVLLGVLCMLLTTSPHGANADVYLPQTLDVTLINADAIVFATVTSVSLAPDDERAIDVKLSNPRIVSTRWRASELKIDHLRVAGRLELRDGVQRVRIVHGDILREGTRYLLMLRGGAWQNAPLPYAIHTIYPVREDGVVECAGGEVYGIGPMGLLCSLASDQAGEPVTEAQLGDLLAISVHNARERRPEIASSADSNVQPLQFVRSGGAR